MTVLLQEYLHHHLSYTEYRTLLTALLAAGKTTGPVQTPFLLEYTRLNEQRMNRIDKTFRLAEASQPLLARIDRPMLWLTLTEGWCGDAAQIVPTLHGLALANPNIRLAFLLRDEHPELMDAFLTNGSRSIPIVIFADPTTGHIHGSWGPRPAEPQAMMMQFKAEMTLLSAADDRKAKYEEAKLAIHTWYAHDRTVRTQREVLEAALRYG